MNIPPRRLLALAGAGLAFSLAACTTSTGAGSDGSASAAASDYKLPAAAQTVLDKAVKAPTWTPPKTSPKAAKGKFVVSIPCAEAAVGCARPGDAFLQAAKALGWRTQLIDPAGDPKKTQAALKQALQLGANGVWMPGGTVEAVGTDLLKQMRKAGVAMFTLGGRSQPLGPSAWSGIMNNDYGLTSPALAAYVAKDSGGKAKVLMVNDSEFPDVANGVKVFESKIGEYCPGCRISQRLDFSITDISTTLPSRVKAILQAHPDINYIYAPYDFAATQMSTALAQAGLAGKVKLVGADGNPQNIQAIKDGTQTVSYARPSELMGWVVADQMNRIFNGRPTIDDAAGFQTEDYPTQLLDKSNLPADVAKPWDAGVDYQSAYKKLWGVG
ncbi:substrate-binding domain-containing protein [Streptomyces sp. NPDC048278]|uniref:sugar ABC transporter substrate-binding protein n=1 Tax=Streptomyces sp. NPDC048278 TaxID=3155809 RepID=UPI0034345D47